MSQTADNTWRVPSPTDAQLLAALESIAKCEAENATFTVSAPGLTLGSFSSADGFLAEFADGDWRNSRLIQNAHVSLQGGRASVAFHRHVTTFTPQHQHQHQTAPSRWEAEFYFYNSPSNPIDRSLALRVLEVIGNLASKLGTNATKKADPENFKDVFAYQFAQLNDLHVRIVQDAEDARVAAEKDMAKRRAGLEADFDERRHKLEADIEGQRAELKSAIAEFEDKKKELDDRGHMHARRQMRSEITAALKQRLENPRVSRQTNSSRQAFLMIASAFLVAAAGYAAFTAYDVHKLLIANASETALIVGLVRFGLGAAVTTGLLFYLLGWLKHLQAEDLRAERDLERYRYDLDRASWSIETILEAQGKESGEVPEEWISGVTRGLFARSEAKDTDHNSMEALGSLLNVAAEAELGPAGPRLKITNRGIQKLKKSGMLDAAE